MAEYYRELPPVPNDFEHDRFPSRVGSFSAIMAVTYIAAFSVFGALILFPITKNLLASFLSVWIPYALGVWVFYIVYDKMCPLRCGPAGICSYNSFMAIRRVEWKNIRSIKWIPVAPGISYLIAVDEGSAWFGPWIPLFLTDNDRFLAAVEHFAGKDHILATSLRKRRK